MNALRTAWTAGPLVLVLWVFELAVAAMAGGAVRAMAIAALGEFALPPDGRLLAGIAELGENDPSLRAGLGAAIFASLVVGLVVWTIAAPLLIVWLQSPRENVATRWARALGPAIATTAWHLLARVVLFALAISGISSLPRSLAMGVLAILLVVCGAALDVARVQVVAFAAPGTSLRTALAAFVAVLRRPASLAALAGIHLAQWVVAGIVLAITLRQAGGAPWLVRGVALVGTAMAAVRMAIALRMGPLGLDKPAADRG